MQKVNPINLPSSLKRLERDTFSGCTGLRSVTLPNGLEHIGSGAFRHCSSLERITIPKSVRELPSGNLFYGCNNLKYLEISVGFAHCISTLALPPSCQVHYIMP